jgi:hypothetical protein
VKRATFWRWLAYEQLEDPWLVFGYFNMVESQEDKEGMSNAVQMPEWYKDTYFTLKGILILSDPKRF